MKKGKSTIILIDDQLTDESRPFKDMREKGGYSVKSFTKIKKGIKYIKDNLNEKLIVILDFEFTENEPDGLWGLQQIREKSMLIPVILLTYNKNVSLSKFPEFINNKLFAYADKNKINDIITKIDDAENVINNSVSGALEEWIMVQEKEKREKPYMISANGKEFSLDKILQEVRAQSEFGREFIKDLNALTIHLLLKKKIKI